MARVQLHVTVRGHVSNDVARAFEQAAQRFVKGSEAAGLEVRGDGLSVDFDEEIAVEPSEEADPA